MIHPKVALILCLSCTFLIACDPAIDYKQIVDNTSDFDIWLIYRVNQGSDTILLPSKTETIVYSFGGIGTVLDYKNCDKLQLYNPMLSPVDSTRTILIKIDSLELWQPLIMATGYGGGEVECRFGIRNEHIK